MKLASPYDASISRPTALQKDDVLRHDWLKITKLRLFVAGRLRHKKAELTNLNPSYHREEGYFGRLIG